MKQGKCLRIYLTESHRIDGMPAIEAVINLCRDSGLRGVSVMRGIEGFGLHGLHSTSFLSLSSDLPVIVEVVDGSEQIDQALSKMRPKLGNSLVAVWPVEIMRSNEENSHA